jgi:uncharacterized protein YmfQ (DUF2313 family)
MPFEPTSQHFQPLRQLFPLPLMSGDADVDFDVEGLALDRAVASAGTLAAQLLPSTATADTIDDWERFLGLIPASDTLSVRQAAAAAKKSQLGGLSRDYFYELAEGLGYNRYPSASDPHIRIQDGVYAPFRADISRADIDAVYDAANGGESTVWRVSGTSVSSDTILRALYEDLKPVQTLIEYVDI